MALTRTNIIGRIALPDDTNPVNSVVRFIMTGFDTDDTENATIIQIPIDATIDALGDIDVNLWPNPLGVRSTFYATYVRIPDGNTNDVISIYLGQISVPSTGGPYDLNDLLPIAPPAGADVAGYIAQLAAAVASTEANATTATDAAAAAVISAAQAALYDGIWLDSVAALFADTALTYIAAQPGTVTAGDIIQTRSERYSYEVAASGASDQHISTAGGVKLYILPNGSGEVAVGAFGVVPDSVTNWEVSFSSRMLAIYQFSITPGVTVVWPNCDVDNYFNTGLNLGPDYSGSRMHFDGSIFSNIVHIIESGGVEIEDVYWTGDIASFDRLGLSGANNIRLPETIRMISDATKNPQGTANRGVHFIGSSGVSWGEIIVDDTGPTQAALPGAQTIWAGMAIQCQTLSGFSGSVHIKNASGHGVYINALDIDIDIKVDGYGKSLIDFTGVSFLEGTDSEAQSEQGCGVWLNRCTGRVGLEVSQSNATPLADKYSVLFDETGISSVANSRNRPLRVTNLVASVGNGNRGVCVGEGTTPSPAANVAFECSPLIIMRSGAATLESGYSGMGVRAPSTAGASYRRLTSNADVGFSGFTTQTCFYATSGTGTGVYTEISLSGLYSGNTGAGRFAQFDGTNGTLKGRVGRIDALYSAGSSASPVVDIDTCVGLNIDAMSLISNSPLLTTALRINANENCEIAAQRVYNFGRDATTGGVLFAGNTECTFGPVSMGRGTLANVAFAFSGTNTDCTFTNLKAENFAEGFTYSALPTFTRCTAIQCTAISNTDDTDLTLAIFPAANQLGCTNFAI